MQNQHKCTDLIQVFNHLFEESYNTVLIGGGTEPLYEPASLNTPARVVFREDYFASALHEVAHWCIAGRERRLQVDYGYWYKPDGRTSQEQSLFFDVEAKPQAMERMFASACRLPFHLSLDNLDNPNFDVSLFVLRVREEIDLFLKRGLPLRANQFYQALREFYGVASPDHSISLNIQ